MFPKILFTSLVVAGVTCAAVAEADDRHRPFRGAFGISVLLCKYSDAPAPSKSPDFYARQMIEPGTGGLADFLNDISHGSITLEGSQVRGWYTLDQTEAEARAYGGGGSSTRGLKHKDCVDKAKEEGYTPPDDHLVVVVSSPGIDTFGGFGGAFVREDASVGTIAHEVGHGLSLRHSMSDDPNYCNVGWASIGEYDDRWDLMSFGNVRSMPLGEFGRAGPSLNTYHQDRMGWLDRDKILRFGADGRIERQVTLTASTRPEGNGFLMVRIPFDVNDLYRYYTVEYRVAEEWDGGIGADRVMIRETKNATLTKCSTGNQRSGGYRSYLLRDPGNRTPLESIDRNGVEVDVISKDPSAGRAVVRIRSARPLRCVQGFVWREARPEDRVCVTPARRAEVREENRLADSRRQPGGGAYGPDTCRQGYVWREAFPGDHVCVPPASRSKAREENSEAHERLARKGA